MLPDDFNPSGRSGLDNFSIGTIGTIPLLPSYQRSY